MEGVNTASHVLLWVILLAIGGWLIYSATHSSTENNRYAPGSASYDVKITDWPLSFGCVPISVLQDKLKPVEVKRK